MRFEEIVTISTKKSRGEILDIIESKFKKISNQQKRLANDDGLVFISINASFGSINRFDKTTIFVNKRENGWTIKADVLYRTSLAFWIFIIIGLFTYIFWLLPIIFYLTQKGTVREEVQRTLNNIKAEYNNENSHVVNNNADELLKLAELRDKNIITNEEFEEKKKQILGL